MRKLSILAALAALISSPAYAVTLKPGSPACLTEDLYSQLTKAVYSKDMDALQYLSQSGCTISGEPVRVTVLELSSWGALAHVRAYRGKHSAEVWVGRTDLDGYDPLKP